MSESFLYPTADRSWWFCISLRITGRHCGLLWKVQLVLGRNRPLRLRKRARCCFPLGLLQQRLHVCSTRRVRRVVHDSLQALHIVGRGERVLCATGTSWLTWPIRLVRSTATTLKNLYFEEYALDIRASTSISESRTWKFQTRTYQILWSRKGSSDFTPQSLSYLICLPQSTSGSIRIPTCKRTS